MEIENEVREVIKYFSGIKSSLPHGLTQANDAEEMTNFVTRRGRLRKIWGTTLKFTSGAGGGPIQWISRLANRWVAQHGAAILKELTEGQYDFEQIGEIALGAANRVRSAKWENRLFLSNGVENKFFEYTPTLGWKYLNLGLTPPGNGLYSTIVDPSLTQIPSVGSGMPDQYYGYVITWWDEIRQVESLPNNSQIGEDGIWFSIENANYVAGALNFTGMSNSAVRVNIAALKAAGYDERVTHFIVYRGEPVDPLTSVPSFFKRVADPRDGGVIEQALRISNDHYDDKTVNASLGQVLEVGNSPPPSGKNYGGGAVSSIDLVGNYGARFVEQFRDQLWLFGVRYPGSPLGITLNTTGNGTQSRTYQPQTGIAYASDVGNPDYWLYTFDIGKSTGQEDTGIAKHDDILMFFKSRSSYRLLGSSPENYEIREMDPKRGISFAGSLAVTTIGVIGLSAEGFVLFSGGKGVLIADELFDLVSRVNKEHADLIAATFDPVEEKYECSFPLDEFTHNSHVFSFDCKTKSWALTRKRFGAAAYEELGNNAVAGLLGDAQNGRLYEASNTLAMTLNGQTMHGSWRSGAFDCGAPGKLKSVQVVEITARALGDFRLSVALIPDFGQGDAAQVNDINPDVRDDNWASGPNDTEGMTWDHGQWSKNSRKKRFTVLIQGIGKNFNLIIKNSDTDADRANFEIEEVIVRASLLAGDKS